MASFRGFPDGRLRLTPLPEPFFKELLPQIDHLGELKVCLYALWRLDRMEGNTRYVRRDDFAGDERFMQGLAAAPEEAALALDDSLQRAVQRGTLLKAVLSAGDGPERWLYFLNSPKGRATVEAIQKGDWQPTGRLEMPVDLVLDGPNIFRLYEDHIGPLTPMIADALRDAESAYPPAWIEEAVRIAVENNKRSWRYIAAILTRWQQEGRDERKDRSDTEKNRRRYAEWENNDPSGRER